MSLEAGPLLHRRSLEGAAETERVPFARSEADKKKRGSLIHLQRKTSHESFVMRIPKIIYGTAWKKERTCDLTYQAVKSGFRGIDVACQPKHYNERGVGQALAKLKDEGITRNAIFIQTKFTSLDGQDLNQPLPYDSKATLSEQMEQSLQTSLKNLETDHIDSLVLHSPMRTLQATIEAWKKLEDFHDRSVVKHIGISNIHQLPVWEELYDKARVKPHFVQNSMHEGNLFDCYMRESCRERNVQYQSFWTLTGAPRVLKHPHLLEIARKKGWTPEQVWFRYHIEDGVIPLSGTTSQKHMEDDVMISQIDEGLSEEEKTIIHKFLWG
ncbi:aldo/keto reductase [Planoprotostelium fungivorum]|uniref:Aldo/keto reductase n=1 Tax=Planoprotostelium fungivorum TaxID=1890364 RepID=A0A2P6NC91_9EUKA|nr:aldo/keto reductase [Planoprotostelium fungivorum]